MRFSTKLTRLAAAAALVLALAAVSGCREEEQGRILLYQKGTYLGQPDQDITDAQRQELRARARNQAF
jgi:hypothetical protein